MSSRLEKELAKKAIGYGQLKADPSDLAKKPSHLEKYTYQDYTYPADLFDPQKPVGPYVVFYINAFEGARITSDESKLIAKDDNIEVQKARNKGAAARMAETSKDLGKNFLTTSGLVGAGIAGGVGSLLANAGPIGGGAGVGFAAVGVAALSELNFQKSQRRLKTAIALHMPNDLAITYKAGYASDNASNILGTMKVGEAAINAGNTVVKEFTSMLADEKGLESAKSQITNASTGKLSDTLASITTGSANSFVKGAALNLLPGGGTLSVLSGVAANPKTQAVFAGVDPRTFGYTYNFFAKDEAELENIQRIISTFKANMLPEYKDTDQFLFTYPSEFDIIYYMGAEENKYIHKHISCVLETMSISYTPDGQFSFFNSNGAPVRVTVHLMFRELDIVTKQDAEAGY